ncbi:MULTISPECIES: STAS domain-containing protein [unclassified Streptomyces]|uniref:STAS domain-containing protein n=1 Tax=unclassified Streptomyces TaxID=2593676 RepID=UPI002DD844E2|nr:STAS domain-containing protein [Streptomyces sp. NBC_01257]WRZ67920.1 STAS domain-containing protein [Streptomyces sp. NBC_01257]WSU61868.1 STAS domain-containing protein [Streptomyces sp. NBC_01104]
MSRLTITARDSATGPVLGIVGDLDHATAPELRRVVDSLPGIRGRLLVLELAGLEFCDSSGITALLAARNLATEKSGDIALAAVPANTARILRIIGLDRVFTLHPDLPTATAPTPQGADHRNRVTRD